MTPDEKLRELIDAEPDFGRWNVKGIARAFAKWALEQVTALCDRYDNEQALDTDWLIDELRALAAQIGSDDGK